MLFSQKTALRVENRKIANDLYRFLNIILLNILLILNITGPRMSGYRDKTDRPWLPARYGEE